MVGWIAPKRSTPLPRHIGRVTQALQAHFHAGKASLARDFVHSTDMLIDPDQPVGEVRLPRRLWPAYRVGRGLPTTSIELVEIRSLLHYCPQCGPGTALIAWGRRGPGDGGTAPIGTQVRHQFLSQPICSVVERAGSHLGQPLLLPLDRVSAVVLEVRRPRSGSQRSRSEKFRRDTDLRQSSAMG